ncbi:ABC transporter permease [Chachezhania antarctica]|uniref:ABC transporter permease n=1 Tax=Chachezhania antarctica TaxID=2340860 RepID=UPI000EAF4F27|nr:ABC transporter permease [Chachezhania antarctica]|tara:strand:+ start:5814 stop:6677 length:864 start_codon:yes stop_codon:yes gene_type:complete
MTDLPAGEIPAGSSSRTWRRMRRNPAMAIGVTVLTAVVFFALIGPMISPYDPYDTALRMRLKPPSAAHWLGTDSQGRDLATRLMYGARTTLMLGLAGVAFAALTGGAIGLLAAFYKRLDNPLMRLIDVLLSFPSILFGLSLAAMMGPGLHSLILAIGLSIMPGIARISRGAALSVMAQDFMDGGRVIGLPDVTLMRRYLLANAYAPILTYVTLAFGDAVLLAAALGFLGLGLQPPTAELGSIAAEGRSFLFIAPHVSFAASALIFLIVLPVNMLGDTLRDAADRRAS